MNEGQNPKRLSRYSPCFGKTHCYPFPRSALTKTFRLHAMCKKSNNSVPRNRVFLHYATRCGTERVPPLNPASFGKLVRIIFPGIQTRRLGMRGESKYHYVDLSLIEDPQAVGDEDRGSVCVEVNNGMEKPSLRRYAALIGFPWRKLVTVMIPFCALRTS